MAPFQRVGAGQKLPRPSATEHNAFIDAALDYRKRARSAVPGAAPDPLPPGMVRVQNNSGSDQPQFATLAISGILTASSSSTDQLRRCPVVTGITPAPDGTESHKRNFVVLDEPIKTGKIGRAYIDGLAVASVNVSDTTHGFATPAAGGDLKSAESGHAKLVWSPGTGVHECLILLGGGGGGCTPMTYITNLQVTSTAIQYKSYNTETCEESVWTTLIELTSDCPETA